MKLKIFLAPYLNLSVLFVFSTCPQAAFVPDPNQSEDVQEATFRYFFTHELAGSKAEAFCISSTKTLPGDFTKRFASSDPPVVWSSKCPLGPTKSAPLVKGKQPAERVSIMSFHWITAVETEVRGHCRDGELGSTQLVLHLVRINGRWAVVRIEREGDS